MKCFYKAKVFKYDGSEHDIVNSFEIVEDEVHATSEFNVDRKVLISDYLIRCHVLVDNFKTGETSIDKITITNWEVLI